MTDKSGTHTERRAATFAKIPATATSLCPFRKPEVAIVPVRYALDRSRYDAAPEKLKPLLKGSRWAVMPKLKTRSYTLRQLYDGYVYVYDETAEVLHEYAVSAATGNLSRIVWTDAQLGSDQRSGGSDAKPFLLYPRNNLLRIAFSAQQWTWRIFEHLRSNPASRASWMKMLDLKRYCMTMAEPDTLPLNRIAEAVADIDKEHVVDDDRFADSAVPTSESSSEETQPLFSPIGADVFWQGSVEDQDSSLLIALDDPLAIFNDLGMQLAADQAAYRNWQAEHEHKIQIAQTVTTLCGAESEPEKLPASVRNNAALTHQYLSDVEAYFEQCMFEQEQIGNNTAPGGALLLSDVFKSPEMRRSLQTRYGSAPSDEALQAWKDRHKWRREVDLSGARQYLQQHLPTGDTLLQQVRDTQSDFRQWSTHLGTEPLKLFVDPTHPESLLYLQTLMLNLQIIYAQDNTASAWLAEQETNDSSLFGTLRYGFSPALKHALHQEANALLNGLGDITNLATRIGELNGTLNHQGFADKPWMKALKQPVQDTFKALGQLASNAGKATFESILLAWVPIDSRLAVGKQQNIVALIRTLLIGQILLDSKARIAIDHTMLAKLKNWISEWRVLNKQISDIRRSWLYPTAYNPRKSIASHLRALEQKLRLHELSMPALLDYQNNQYAKQLQDEIRLHFQSGKAITKEWLSSARRWLDGLGGIAGSITWGVIMLNFINTAFTYRDLTRDGDFSAKDIGKVTYGLGYSFNLLMAVFVEAPWAVIRDAKPLSVGGYNIGILDKSAAYWKARGNAVWGDAIRGFRGSMVAMGAFGIAAALEAIDISNDRSKLKTSAEKNATVIKGLAVAAMGLASFAQLLTGLSLASRLTTVVMSPWFSLALLIAGTIYLFATMVLNYFKQDSVGWWLRKCCWSRTPEHRHANTAQEQNNEIRSLLQIQLSPQIYVKSTVHYEDRYLGKGDYISVAVQNGAGIQVRLPGTLRGSSVSVNVISSKRPWGVLPVEKIDRSVQADFLDRGQFRNVKQFGTLTNKPAGKAYDDFTYPLMPPQNEDVIWETWVPLDKDASYLELQIYYPFHLASSSQSDTGYSFQLELDTKGSTSFDGLTEAELEVKSSSRAGVLMLEIAN
ncbi:T6SS effector BTH_I2691 family protein [Pseudomonas syringae]|uniref:T6SS effector BTH_I2691 family protein n=1 Tax=Pseudomonas syringae TaxID=317 RepID=UPI0023F70685|nr:T6SS effector BTH_I2691 family protein [Pseudomonas syringae]MDF7793998.1 T6SS effector BTH_I2691 family protein [Pseudomonas syringae]